MVEIVTGGGKDDDSEEAVAGTAEPESGADMHWTTW